MKLITLNIWGGHVLLPLLAFFQAHADIDIVCLQEVYHNAAHKVSDEDRAVHLSIFLEIAKLLPDHQGFFRPVLYGFYGIAMFVKKEVQVLQEGETIIHQAEHYKGLGPGHSRNAQWLMAKAHGQPFAVVNVHGLWNGAGKTDTPQRLAQSACLKQLLKQISVPTILCGDFNLRPDTKSLCLLEEGMQNLVKTHHVTSTRTAWYTKAERFADYVLVSPEVNVQQFAVLPAEVSDHAPLYLEFNLNVCSVNDV